MDPKACRFYFPWPLLLIGLIGNFIGEEVYFRGYLLKKIGRLRFDWLILSILFQFYHMWQAPINWAFTAARCVVKGPLFLPSGLHSIFLLYHLGSKPA
ncbi:CPBP family intramembrane metalloprotease [Paenibacillus melissococcoides]|uniref:CPBP family intramembrane metalloprotease n=1 Tax=Paenibacillus melissococcoides TaxID=2912268 RepID=A0ABM9G7X0_9BACL|nr:MULTISPECIES: CPBP family intramembrane glutamic endopeptidase [Paenibacillus]MEB9895178.1 CPBP family intramembrane metalloprotease [Bacillus cereus]CAH8247854.1 CPBP family intramembrane metalloprotease [Paenibacillus melissococcoides]CAH8719342.1 CPBP family intramembrane metalloprotease [Paenibacillus melissococcoides]CAH8720353.1 CPBP family intramembrane metalloprotease [Paenibacillus melissococcoides]